MGNFPLMMMRGISGNLDVKLFHSRICVDSRRRHELSGLEVYFASSLLVPMKIGWVGPHLYSTPVTQGRKSYHELPKWPFRTLTPTWWTTIQTLDLAHFTLCQARHGRVHFLLNKERSWKLRRLTDHLSLSYATPRIQSLRTLPLNSLAHSLRLVGMPTQEFSIRPNNSRWRLCHSSSCTVDLVAASTQSAHTALPWDDA